MLKANWLCNDLGMDPISMGSTLAAAMELYRDGGVVTDDDGGVDRLNFGSGGSADSDDRSHRLSARALGMSWPKDQNEVDQPKSLSIPRSSWASKGQEFPAYDPRGFQGMGVAYATCNRGGLSLCVPGHQRPETTGAMEPHTTRGQKRQWVAQ